MPKSPKTPEKCTPITNKLLNTFPKCTPIGCTLLNTKKCRQRDKWSQCRQKGKCTPIVGLILQRSNVLAYHYYNHKRVSIVLAYHYYNHANVLAYHYYNHNRRKKARFRGLKCYTVADWRVLRPSGFCGTKGATAASWTV